MYGGTGIIGAPPGALLCSPLSARTTSVFGVIAVTPGLMIASQPDANAPKCIFLALSYTLGPKYANLLERDSTKAKKLLPIFIVFVIGAEFLFELSPI